MKILITELMWDVGIKELEQKGFTVHYDKNLSKNRSKLLSIISEYDGLIVRNQTKIDKELLEKANKLRGIGRLGVGLDNIDLQAAKRQQIKVVTAKNGNATSVSEYVLATMMDACKNIPEAADDVQKGNWDRKRFTGTELNGKTLGLFGLGEIANRVARRAKVFGMNVIGLDPFVTSYDFVLAETGVERVETIEDLLKVSDFISIHVPLTESTKNIFNYNTFAQMKSNSYLINTSRGGIINEQDLCKAIESEQIAGAYLDVLEQEPITNDSPLLSIKNIKVTPHVAGLTEESQVRISRLVATEVAKVLNDELSLCTVN